MLQITYRRRPFHQSSIDTKELADRKKEKSAAPHSHFFSLDEHRIFLAEQKILVVRAKTTLMNETSIKLSKEASKSKEKQEEESSTRDSIYNVK